MKTPSFEQLHRLSLESFCLKKDNRPQLLKDMTNIAETTTAYNRFLYELAKNVQPSIIVETGTDRGRSAVHFAAGCPQAQVITIDIDQNCSNEVRSFGFKNIVAITSDSLEFTKQLYRYPIIDILFIDSLHNFHQTYREYEHYRPYVREGGLIIFDDIRINGEMTAFWNYFVIDKKFDLSVLHFSGFGIAIKNADIIQPYHEAVNRLALCVR